MIKSDFKPSKAVFLFSAAQIAILVGLNPASAFAQATVNPVASPQVPADSTDQASGGGQDVVVTGSRIARSDLASSVPVAVISSDRILASGASNIQDVLSELPAFGQAISRTSSNFQNTGNGVATVNLRNLGSSRTLVLIDGRRTLGIPGSSAVDVNNIPTDLLDRVEVVTGGASAVYGSEAVAGVVNFILKNNYEGLGARLQTGVTDKGDDGRQTVSVTAGHNFSEGRGNLTANFTYDNDDGLFSRDRAFSAHDLPNRSSYAAQGIFSVDPNGAFSTNGNTYTFTPSNTVKSYQGANVDGYDRNQVRLLSVPVQRYQGTVLGHYDFSPLVTAYVEGEYDHTNSNASLEALAVANTGPGAALNFDGSDYAGIPITSPYVPDTIRNAAIANGVDVIQFRRRSVDIFSRSNNDKRNFYRGVAGLRGDLGNSWKYDLYYEHSESRDHTSAGAIYAPNYGAALSNQLDANGNVVCSDAAARAAGCVPVDIFGYNTVTPAGAKFLTTYTGPTKTVALVDGPATFTNGQPVTYDYLAQQRQDVGSLTINGNLFSLWGGPISVAFGAEYRYERSSELFDPFTRAGLSSGNQISDTVGHFGVAEGFGEIVAPIVEDRPGIKYLGLEGAARYASYSTVGGVWSYKGGGTYAPSRDIRFRAVYARATRAPNIGELFSSQSETFPAVNDPCDQNNGNGDVILNPKALPAQCANIPGVAKTVAQRGGFYYTTSDIQTIDGLLGGNINLKAETADTITAGTVITPSFLRGFSLTADYYHIKINNAIGIIGQQVSVSQCFATGNPVFCSNVIRNPNTGLITRVNALNLNTGSYLVSGVDLEGRYSSHLDRLGINGNAGFDILWNHRFKQQQTPYPGGEVQNEIGQADCYSCGRLGSGFHDRINGNFIFAPGPFTLNYRVDYLGPLYDNLDGSVAVPTRIPAYVYHNIQVRVAVGQERKFELYFGVNNLTDKQPPQFGDTNPVTWPGSETVADTYDVFGRTLYAGVTFKF